MTRSLFVAVTPSVLAAEALARNVIAPDAERTVFARSLWATELPAGSDAWVQQTFLPSIRLLSRFFIRTTRRGTLTQAFTFAAVVGSVSVPIWVCTPEPSALLVTFIRIVNCLPALTLFGPSSSILSFGLPDGGGGGGGGSAVKVAVTA